MIKWLYTAVHLTAVHSFRILNLASDTVLGAELKELHKRHLCPP